MKFDVIISNPPYHLNVGVTKENYSISIYQKFIEQAKKLDPNFIIMIIPSRWFTGGRDLDEFRKTMLEDKHIYCMVNYINSKDCFPGVDISGGVLYFVINSSIETDLCNYTNIYDNKKYTVDRKLNEFSIFPKYNEALSIIHKIKRFHEDTLEHQVSVQTPFGFISTFRGEPKPFINSIELISSGGKSYVTKDSVKKNANLIDKYKIIFSKATCEHAGIPGKDNKYRVISSNDILFPNQICTQSYLVGGAFDTEIEARNFWGYLKTNFFRFLLLQGLSSQDLSREKFQFVPMQDFSKPWTDEELYAKYDISPEEQQFIDSMIKPME